MGNGFWGLPTRHRERRGACVSELPRGRHFLCESQHRASTGLPTPSKCIQDLPKASKDSQGSLETPRRFRTVFQDLTSAGDAQQVPRGLRGISSAKRCPRSPGAFHGPPTPSKGSQPPSKSSKHLPTPTPTNCFPRPSETLHRF